MKLLLIAIALLCPAAQIVADQPGSGSTLQDGDIVFHRSQTRQSAAIAAATGSEYTHMGIVFFVEGKPYVFEAVQPVSRTPLQQWIDRGNNGKFTAKRLRDTGALDIPALKREVSAMLGKDYDWHFSWCDERIYCSELVWKAYQRALDIELGTPRRLRDFNLEIELVRGQLKERYGADIPLDRKVIAPSDIAASPLLEVVQPAAED